MRSDKELLSLQFKVASSTESISGVQLIDLDGKIVPFHPSGTATGTIVVTDAWQSFKQLWLTAVRLVDPSISNSQWETHLRKFNSIAGFVPIRLAGLTNGIQVRGATVVDSVVRTFWNDDVLDFGGLPDWLRRCYNHESGNKFPADDRTRAITPVVQNAAYGAGDVLFIPQVISNLMRGPNEHGYLSTIRGWDFDNAGEVSDAALDLYFWRNASVSMAAINAPLAISDGDMVHLLGKVSIASTEWQQIGSTSRFFQIGLNDSRLAFSLIPVLGTPDVWVGGVTQGTPTPGSTSAIRLEFSALGA